MKVTTLVGALLGFTAMLGAAGKGPVPTPVLRPDPARFRPARDDSGSTPGFTGVRPPRPGTDDSMWVTVGSINSLIHMEGLKVYGDQIWQTSSYVRAIRILDRLTGTFIRHFTLPGSVYLDGITRFGADNESLAIASYGPTNAIYVGDTLGNWTRSFRAPSGYGCHGLDWDGCRFWIADDINDRFYTCSKTGTLLRTLTASGTPVGSVTDICLDRMYPDRLWAVDRNGDVVHFISFDTLANTYQIRATYDHPGDGYTAEGIGFWTDGVGNGYCYTNAFHIGTIWQQQVHRPVLTTDVGVFSIIYPEVIVVPGSGVPPSCYICNLGTAAQSNIPVVCWIDSGATRVYTSTQTYAGPLAPQASAAVTFAPEWITVANGARYTVRMFTALPVDSNRTNDTARRVVTVVGPSPCRYFEPEWTLPNDGHTIYAACVVQDSLLWVAHGYYPPNRILVYRVSDLVLIDSFPADPEYLDFYYHEAEDAVYALSADSLDRWDATTHAFLGRVHVPESFTAISGEGDSLYLSGFYRGIFKCATDGTNCHQVALAPPQQSAIGLAVDSTHRRLFCTSSYSPPDHVYQCDMLSWTWIHDTILPSQRTCNWGGCETFHGDTFLVAVTQDPGNEVRCYRLISRSPGIAGDNAPKPTTDLGLRVAPNPSRGAVAISCALPEPGVCRLRLYDVTGKLIRTLIEGRRPAGRITCNLYQGVLETKGQPATGQSLISRGVYVIELVAGGRRLSQKLIVE